MELSRSIQDLQRQSHFLYLLSFILETHLVAISINPSPSTRRDKEGGRRSREEREREKGELFWKKEREQGQTIR